MQLLAILAESLEYYAPFQSIKQTRLGRFLAAANRFNQTVESTSPADNHEKCREDKRDFLEQNYTITTKNYVIMTYFP